MKKIIIGKIGTGKSYTCMKIARAYEGTVIYLDGVYQNVLTDCHGDSIREFTIYDNRREFSMENNKKYFIVPGENETEIYAKGTELFALDNANDFVEDLKGPRFVIWDDNAWQLQANKGVAFWELCHSNHDVIITVQDTHDLFGAALSEEMLDDVKQYWEVISL